MSKLIKAVFTGRFCRTQRVFQFDTDDQLQIVNVDLPASFTVDFSNSKTGDSVSVLATSDTVQIPPDLFVPGSEIYAWIWLSDSNGGHTRCEATIPIDPRARRTGTEPTPAQASAWDEAVDTLNDAAADYADAMGHGPQIIDGYWHIWDAEAGEYVNTDVKAEGEDGTNGIDGNSIWTATQAPFDISATTAYYYPQQLTGRDGIDPAIGDIVIQSANIVWAVFDFTVSGYPKVRRIGSIKGDPGADGEDGYSPAVTITEITGGHRVTITDEAHPQGQSFDVMDGQGGSGTVDDAFSTTSENPVQNKVITNAFNYASQQLTNLGLALDNKVDKVSGKGLSTNDFSDNDYDKLQSAVTSSDLQTALESYAPISSVPDPSSSNPQDLGTAYPGSSTDYSRADHVHKMPSASDVGAYALPSGGIPASDLASAVQTSLGKADTALQQHQDISGKLDKAQGVAHAGEFVVVGSDGNITTVTMSVWQGGNYGS